MQEFSTLSREVARLRATQGAATAAAWLAARLDAGAGTARGWRMLADLHREDDDTAGALLALERAAALAPADPVMPLLQARLTFEAGEPSSHLFAALGSAHPAGDLVLLGECMALAAEGRGGEAAARIEGELTLRPDWREGHAFLAGLLAERGDPHPCRALDMALRARPGDAGLHALRIDLAMEAGRHAEALDLIRHAPGGEADWLAHRAACLDELGEHRSAGDIYARLGTPKERGLAVRMVRHRLREGNPQSALDLAAPWLDTPEAQAFWPYVGLAWRLAGDPRAAWLEPDSLVGVHDLPEARTGSLAALAEALRAIHARAGEPQDQSLRGGTQSAGHLFARIDPALRRLRGALLEAVQAHATGMGSADSDHPTLRHRRDRPMRLSGSWSVRLTGAGHHVPHVHPAGWLSAVFYVAVPSGDPGALVAGEPEATLGLPLGPLRTVEPRPGRLVVMPSTMWHATRPAAGGERLTVAFDVAVPD